MKDLKGYVMVLGAALFWGASATAAKFLLNRHVDTVVIVQARVTFTALLLLPWLLAFRREALRVPLRDLWRFLLLGVVGVAGSNFTYYFTIKESTVATGILIQYTAPLLVMAYAAWAGRRRPGAIAALFIDLDDFKTVNDTYGHAKGDDVLRGFARTVHDTMRVTDVFGRYGGRRPPRHDQVDLETDQECKHDRRTKHYNRPLFYHAPAYTQK